LIDGDILASAFSGAAAYNTAATINSVVGNYAITPTLGTLASSLGYQFSFVGGNLSVTPAALTVTANNAGRVEGQVNPVFTAGYSGFVLGETESVLGGALNFSTPANVGTAPGSYSITPSGLASGNYTITYQDGTLTITPAPVEVADTQAAEAINPLFTVVAQQPEYEAIANKGETSEPLPDTVVVNDTVEETALAKISSAVSVQNSGETRRNVNEAFGICFDNEQGASLCTGE
jgi:hypothetical protein